MALLTSILLYSPVSMKALPLLSTRSFSFLSTECSVSLMIMEENNKRFWRRKSFQLPLAKEFSRSFYTNRTHKGTHWIYVSQTRAGRLKFLSAKPILFLSPLFFTIMHGPAVKLDIVKNALGTFRNN